MTHYDNSANFERDVMKQFEGAGCYGIRAAGSKGKSDTDVVAIRRWVKNVDTKTRYEYPAVFLIQCKIGKTTLRRLSDGSGYSVNYKEIEKLINVGENLGLSSMIVWREEKPPRYPRLFAPLSNMDSYQPNEAMVCGKLFSKGKISIDGKYCGYPMELVEYQAPIFRLDDFLNIVKYYNVSTCITHI